MIIEHTIKSQGENNKFSQTEKVYMKYNGIWRSGVFWAKIGGLDKWRPCFMDRIPMGAIPTTSFRFRMGSTNIIIDEQYIVADGFDLGITNYSVLSRDVGATTEIHSGYGFDFKELVLGYLPPGKTLDNITSITITCNTEPINTIIKFYPEDIFDDDRYKYYDSDGTTTTVATTINFKAATSDMSNLGTELCIRMLVGQGAVNDLNLPKCLTCINEIEVTLI